MESTSGLEIKSSVELKQVSERIATRRSMVRVDYPILKEFNSGTASALAPPCESSRRLPLLLSNAVL